MIALLSELTICLHLTVRIACIAAILLAYTVPAAGEEFTEAVRTYLQQRIDNCGANIGVVVGIVEAQGSAVVSYGKLDNGTDAQVDGDTVFELGSDTKTFTALLLQDMVQRGEMKLDDPVAKYLPDSVVMPKRNGKEITLRHLATHTSGLPNVPDNLDPTRADNPYAEFTPEKMYAFLSGYRLTRDPGETSEYSNLGMGLLGHVIALKAGQSYESLIEERIARSLKMESTGITLSPELTSRFATAHNQFGEQVRPWDLNALQGAGALRSTANDMLKYVAANLGITPSELTPLMEKAHEQGLAWYAATDPQGRKITFHGGGTGGHRSFVGFDKAQRRGVVVLTNSKQIIDVADLGNFLLRSVWHSDHRPSASRVAPNPYDDVVGQYQQQAARKTSTAIPKSAIYALAAGGVMALGLFAWRADRALHRALILACAILPIGVAAAAATQQPIQSTEVPTAANIGIRREGEQLFAAAIGPRSWPIDALLPPIAGELLPESDNRFFERLGGHRITFAREAQGKVTRLTAHLNDGAFVYEKISDQPPTAAEPVKPRIAIQLDAELLDTLAGQYEFPPSAVYPTGNKAKVWREEDHLLWQDQGQNAVPGAIELYPLSQTTFFTTFDAAILIFDTNNNGEVKSVRLSVAGEAELAGTKRVDE